MNCALTSNEPACTDQRHDKYDGMHSLSVNTPQYEWDHVAHLVVMSQFRHATCQQLASFRMVDAVNARFIGKHFPLKPQRGLGLRIYTDDMRVPWWYMYAPWSLLRSHSSYVLSVITTGLKRINGRCLTHAQHFATCIAVGHSP